MSRKRPLTGQKRNLLFYLKKQPSEKRQRNTLTGQPEQPEPLTGQQTEEQHTGQREQETGQRELQPGQTDKHAEEQQTGQMEAHAEEPQTGQIEAHAEEPQTGQIEAHAEEPQTGQIEAHAEGPQTGQIARPTEQMEEDTEGQTEGSPPIQHQGQKSRALAGAATYRSIFKNEWTSSWPFITRGTLITHYWCAVCRIENSCCHQGVTDVVRHIKTKGHQEKQRALQSSATISQYAMPIPSVGGMSAQDAKV